LDLLSKCICADPYVYLPEKTLSMLWYFRKGYDLRRAMEAKSYSWSDGEDGAFAQWIRKRFTVHARALSHFAVVSSFSLNEVDAFCKYFDLLDEFCAESNPPSPVSERNLNNLSFLDLLRDVRAQPINYLGNSTFLGCCSFLMGEARAQKDLGLPETEERRLFESFKLWVEENKNQAQPRPWFKIVSFWSGGVDCGHTPNGAFLLFWKWLDEYASKIGQPGLFLCPVDAELLPGRHLQTPLH
jgi:hypothetical protein